MPYESKGSALLYFTGSGNFNKNMRLDAKKMGYLINEYGLYKIQKPENKLIETKTEKDIFDILKMEYKDLMIEFNLFQTFLNSLLYFLILF